MKIKAQIYKNEEKKKIKSEQVYKVEHKNEQKCTMLNRTMNKNVQSWTEKWTRVYKVER